tara:strand:+ start:2658 stop:2915 length:258 start_codon:yes stop_codon:yes gene_type:complete
MEWLKRLLLRRDDRLQTALKKIERLEEEHRMLKSGMSSLQSALIAISSNQEGVAQDVHRIQEAIQELLEGLQYQILNGPDDGGWH